MLTNRPTTTGGSPIPVLTSASTTPRPGKRVSASAVPSGTPTSRQSNVAEPETWSESQRHPVQLGIAAKQQRHGTDEAVEEQVHRAATRCTRAALSSPGRRDQIVLGASGIWHEDRLAVAVDAESPDGVLRRPASAGSRRRPGAGALSQRALGRVHHDDVVQVEQVGVALARIARSRERCWSRMARRSASV